MSQDKAAARLLVLCAWAHICTTFLSAVHKHVPSVHVVLTYVSVRLSPLTAAEEPLASSLAGPTTRSRHASLEALAAHGKSKSGSKKKRQAAKRKEARIAASVGAGGSEVPDGTSPPSETMADGKSVPDGETARTEDLKEVKEAKPSHEDEVLPRLAEASDSEEKGSGDEVLKAMGGLRMHGPSFRDLSFRSSDSDRPSRRAKLKPLRCWLISLPWP